MFLQPHPEALEELDAAVVWHDRERPGQVLCCSRSESESPRQPSYRRAVLP
jgi:hypothetical protein